MITTATTTKIHPPMVVQPAPKIGPSYRPRMRDANGNVIPSVPATGSNTPTIGNNMHHNTENGAGFKEKSQLGNVAKGGDSLSFMVGADILQVSLIVSSLSNLTDHQILSNLPATLPAELPPKYLSTPTGSPIQTSFTELATGSKRRSTSRDEPMIGLGLTLDPSKRHKQQHHHDFSGVLAQMGTRKLASPSKVGWHAHQWADYGNQYVSHVCRFGLADIQNLREGNSKQTVRRRPWSYSHRSTRVSRQGLI